jgi:hypothetical protein
MIQFLSSWQSADENTGNSKDDGGVIQHHDARQELQRTSKSPPCASWCQLLEVASVNQQVATVRLLLKCTLHDWKNYTVMVTSATSSRRSHCPPRENGGL